MGEFIEKSGRPNRLFSRVWPLMVIGVGVGFTLAWICVLVYGLIKLGILALQ
jgi:hypothetical protein